MYNLKISSGANNDLNDSYLWYEEQQKDLGNKFLQEVFQTFNTVSETPFLFSIRFSQKFRFANLNRFPYLVVYEAFDDQIIINAVFHTSRDTLRF